jgi:hypothetical protein
LIMTESNIRDTSFQRIFPLSSVALAKTSKTGLGNTI